MAEIELLCPAQNLKSIKAVKKYADAVYFGTEALNMRMTADNISLEELPDVVEYAHQNRLKAYLTSNVIIYENELDYIDNQFQIAKNAGIDAIIVHDMAALELAREKNIPFHISTQASVSNSRSAQFYEHLGAERIILARECNLRQIKAISQKLSTTDIEAFVHGAQCTSISGRCYFSAYVNGDPICSANRGKCLQPCRHKWKLVHPNGAEIDYEEGFFLNSKDLCMIGHMPKLMEAGIKAFKIEGRMRDPHYIQVVAKAYKEAISAVQEGTYTPEKINSWLEQLRSVYNRGFSTGFYFGRPGPADIALESSGNQATTKKVQIGKVLTYYRKVKAAKVQLNFGRLRLGDTIVFEGAKTGTYLEQKIQSMQIKMENQTVTPEARPGQPILVSLLVDEPVKKGDWIYRYIPKAEYLIKQQKYS